MLTDGTEGLERVIDRLSPIAIYDFLEPRDILALLLCNSRFLHWLQHDGALIVPSVRLGARQQLSQGRIVLPLVARVTTVPRVCNLAALLSVFGCDHGIGPNVKYLDINTLSSKNLTVPGLAYVVNCCPALERLHLVGINLDKEFNRLLLLLRKLPRLRELVVSGCGAAIDADLMASRMPNVKKLELAGNAPVKSFVGLEALEELKYFVKGSAVNEEYIKPIKEVLPRLKSLSLDASRLTTPKMLESLALHDDSNPPILLENLELKSSSISIAQDDFGPALGRLLSHLPFLKSLSFNWSFVLPGKGNSSIDSLVEHLDIMSNVTDLQFEYQSGTTRLAEFISKFPSLETLGLTGPLESAVLGPSQEDEKSNVKRLTVVDTSASSSLRPENLRALLRLCPMVENLTLTRGCGVTPNDVTALSRVCRETLSKLTTVEIRKAKLGMPSSGPLLVESIVRLMPASVQSVTLLYTDISVLGYRSVKSLAVTDRKATPEVEGGGSPRFAALRTGSTRLRERSATVSAEPAVESLNVSLGRSVELVVRSQANQAVELCHLDLPRRRTFSWDF
ncbi:hypothetical protein FOZ60_013850 [Perkinsus olseni]|uniref:Uncharacterized protein n=1 Tax=Perkinsus olseni TaxID=32597 RepID=A0A7J6N8V8_PEROL|nr:hypothetical protein FOZ60_013850 [Perkinsus olseni]